MGVFVKDEPNENTYFVTVIETLKKKVEEAYNKCDIILDENDFTDVKFKIKKVVESEEETIKPDVIAE